MEDLGNLVLRRKRNESILIDGSIRITVIEISQGDVRLKIQAPRSTHIVRSELVKEAT